MLALEQYLAGDVVDGRRHPGPDLARAARPAVGGLGRRWQRRPPLARPVGGQRRVEELAEPPGVGERRVVGGRPGQGGIDAETDDLHPAAVGPAQRAGREAQVGHPGGVGGGERLGPLGDDLGALPRFERPVGEHVVQ